jgi:hypothetical protein
MAAPVAASRPDSSGKAEGFADGGWANHRQAARLPLPPDKHKTSRIWDAPNEFERGTREWT